MIEIPNNKNYNLEERTLEFSKRIIRLTRALPKNIVNNQLIPQVLRSGCSIGANYIEANESLGKKDFIYRVKISRKEAKETAYWIKLIIEANPEWEQRIKLLLEETIELKKILSSIIEKSKKKK